MRIEKSSCSQSEWDAFICSSPFGDVLQNYVYGEKKKAAGGTVARYAWYGDNGSLLALGQGIIKSRYGLRAQFFPRGPVFKEYNLTVIKQAYKELRINQKKNGLFLSKCTPGFPYVDEYLNIESRYFKKARMRNICQRTSRLDISPSTSELLGSFRKNLRYYLRKDDKNNLYKIMSGVNSELIYDFNLIHQETASKKGFGAHTSTYYEEFIPAFNFDFSRVFLLYKDKKPLAGAVILTHEKKATYLVGASLSDKDIPVGSVLLWNIIQQLKEEGVELFDFQGIPINPDSKKPEWGVYQAKRGFRGEEILLVPEINIYSNPAAAYFLKSVI